MKKILIKGVNWVGDTVLTLPTLRSIKKDVYPNDEVVILVKASLVPLFEAVPYVDRVIGYHFRSSFFLQVVDRLRLIFSLRKEKFDTVFILPNSFDAAFLCFLSSIPKRIGYAGDMRKWLLTQAVTKTTEIKGKHQVDYYFNLLSSTFDNVSFDVKDLFCIPKVDHWVEELAEHEKGMLIGVNPGAAFGSAKRWPEKKYISLCERLTKELNCQIILFGDKNDLAITSEIKSALAQPIIDTAGITTLAQAIYLISKCHLFITNDTGLMHIAGALGVYTIAVFGPTKEHHTSPLGEYQIIRTNEALSCVPCMKRECPLTHHRCMQSIAVDDVFAKVKERVLS